MVLVSIVGDFYSSVLPIFYEYKEQLTKHIILYDDYKNDTLSARKIINGTTTFIKQKRLKIKTYSIKIDEDSLLAIKKVIKIIDSYAPDGSDLHLNVTDGLANIAVLLSQEYLSRGAKILTYDRYDNEYNILTKESMQSYTMQTCIPIREHFMLKDIEIVSIEGEAIANKYEKELNIFFEGCEADRLLYKEFNKRDMIIKNTPTGLLYEQYIYNLISTLSYDDILLGVKIRDRRDDGISIENEYDILIMKENHLHMIECKYLKTLDTPSLLYKLDSVRESLDEDANIFIVTNFDKYNETEGMLATQTTQTYKRAFAKKIILRGSPCKNIREFLSDIDRHFALKSKSLTPPREPYASKKEPLRVAMREEMQNYLQNRLALQANFFDKKQITLLMQYKTYKQTNQATKKAMSDSVFYEFIRLINKMLHSKQEYIAIEDVYEYYVVHLKREGL